MSKAPRIFKPVTRPGVTGPHPTAQDLTVVTCNVLADKFATGGHHSYCPEEHLLWTSREPRILAELAAYQADIICLQEVERPYMEDELGPWLRDRGYEWLYYGRARKPTDPVAGPEEGVCLSYNTSRLEKIATETVRFKDLAPTRLPGASALQKSTGNGRESSFLAFLESREDGAVMALLRDKQTNKQLLACCTHLFWDPRYPEIKATQAALLCAAIPEFLQAHGAATCHLSSRNAATFPIILAGDFNSLPSKTVSDPFDKIPEGTTLVSGAYQLLTQGTIDSAHQDHPASRRKREATALQKLELTCKGLNFASAAVESWEKEPPFTTKTPGFSGTLDYIFFTPGKFEVVEMLEMPYDWNSEGLEMGNSSGEGGKEENEERKVDGFPCIPDQVWPSDHLAMAAKFRWKE